MTNLIKSLIGPTQNTSANFLKDHFVFQKIFFQTSMNISELEMPSLDINKLGVDQPVLATKDIVIIVFMFLLWAYSLYLTYRAWYKILYSDGEEGSNMWR